MKKAPYSRAEAEKLCDHYQQLKGRQFAVNSERLIDCVAISPFGTASRNRFIIFYLLCNDPRQALAHDYKGDEFDVLVISGSVNKFELLHEDVHSWLEKNQHVLSEIVTT